MLRIPTWVESCRINATDTDSSVNSRCSAYKPSTLPESRSPYCSCVPVPELSACKWHRPLNVGLTTVSVPAGAILIISVDVPDWTDVCSIHRLWNTDPRPRSNSIPVSAHSLMVVFDTTTLPELRSADWRTPTLTPEMKHS